MDPRERLERTIRNDYRLIWRLLRRLGVPVDAVDDAAQEVFLIVAERLSDIRENSERAFAFGTALRVAHSARRRRAREPLSEEGEAGETTVTSPIPGADELSDQKRARELLNGVLDAMPLDLRTVFILFELEGMRSPEIAELVGVPLGTVASRLRRAREAFRELVAIHTVPPRSGEDR
ncbi:MAG TPA: sigma-70 family RNA polymerase sigma factor [Polyangiaceae bacterium]|nr:sigma-70 family RNA polymerase sigma factor [Polyangiaceae bacterium]